MKIASKVYLFGMLLFVGIAIRASHREGIALENIDLEKLRRAQQNLQRGVEALGQELAHHRRALGLPEMSDKMVAIGEKFQNLAIVEYNVEEWLARCLNRRAQDMKEYPFMSIWFLAIDYLCVEHTYNADKKEIRREQQLLAQELDTCIAIEAEPTGRLALVESNDDHLSKAIEAQQSGRLASIESKVDHLNRAVRDLQVDMAQVKDLLKSIEKKTHPIENIRGGVQEIGGQVEVLVKVNLPARALREL